MSKQQPPLLQGTAAASVAPVHSARPITPANTKAANSKSAKAAKSPPAARHRKPAKPPPAPKTRAGAARSGASMHSGSTNGKAAVPAPRQARAAKPSALETAYQDALQWLFTNTDYEQLKRVSYTSSNFNLSRMHRLLNALDNPHKATRFVHVAGTKGKGSVCYLTARMLEAAGLRTGLYISPHILDLRERISINSQNIEPEQLTCHLNSVRNASERLQTEHRDRQDPVTFFEIMTAAAFLHFAAEKVDVAVLEVGLGGRLDATNVVRPEVCAITGLSLDHTEQLGKTLDKIAEEKAGIMKEGVPVILYPQDKAIDKQLRAHAEAVGAPVYVIGKDLDYTSRFENDRTSGPHIRICVGGKTSRFDHIRVPLPGEHQGYNLAVAFGLIDTLRARGMNINEQLVLQGLDNFSIPGRMELHNTDPRIILDGAHNAASVEALMKAIGQSTSYDSMVVVFGCNADKDIQGMLQHVQLGADKIIFTRARTGRAADPDQLARRYEEMSGKMAQVAPDMRKAMNSALAACSREDLICVTGSFYLVGEAKLYLQELRLPPRRTT